jgi:hypothetical protein
MKALKWINIVLGVALFLAPFVLGYSDNGSALWTSLMLGVVISVLGFYEQILVNAIVGLVAFVAPWIIGFDGGASALWSFLMLGGTTAFLNSFIGFVNTEGEALAKILQEQHTSRK